MPIQTDGSVPNTLIIANCDIVKPRVAAAEHIAHFNEEARSPFVKKYKTQLYTQLRKRQVCGSVKLHPGDQEHISASTTDPVSAGSIIKNKSPSGGNNDKAADSPSVGPRGMFQGHEDTVVRTYSFVLPVRRSSVVLVMIPASYYGMLELVLPPAVKWYNGSVPFEERVDEVLSYFDLPSSEIPSFMTLYFEDPDHQGIRLALLIQKSLKPLIVGLEKRNVFEDVNVILVDDHGMVSTCDRKVVALDDVAPWIDLPRDWVQSYSTLLSIRPLDGHNFSDIVRKMNEGLRTEKVVNRKMLKIYLKQDLPSRLHYSASDRILKQDLPSRLHYSASNRILPIIGLLDEGFKVEQKRTDTEK
ncbi:hypothetical protein QQ045_009794 [Rhodiola kirilowii]